MRARQLPAKCRHPDQRACNAHIARGNAEALGCGEEALCASKPPLEEMGVLVAAMARRRWGGLRAAGRQQAEPPLAPPCSFGASLLSPRSSSCSCVRVPAESGMLALALRRLCLSLRVQAVGFWRWAHVPWELVMTKQRRGITWSAADGATPGADPAALPLPRRQGGRARVRALLDLSEHGALAAVHPVGGASRRCGAFGRACLRGSRSVQQRGGLEQQPAKGVGTAWLWADAPSTTTRRFNHHRLNRRPPESPAA